jgi:hypothetical protein
MFQLLYLHMFWFIFFILWIGYCRWTRSMSDLWWQP